MSWGQGDSWAAQKARRFVLERDERACQLQLVGCTHRATEVHHLDGLQGRRRQDATDPDELAAVCRECHRLVTEQQRMKAWRAKQEHRNGRRKLPTKPHPGD